MRCAVNTTRNSCSRATGSVSKPGNNSNNASNNGATAKQSARRPHVFSENNFSSPTKNFPNQEHS